MEIMRIKEKECPLNSAERRLLDCMNLLIEVKKNYFEPDLFRLSLNNCIQTLRTVTFVLQKQKGALQGFDEWYVSWQAKMSGDQVLRWLIKARNTIVKEGDLVTRSIAHASILESWTVEPKIKIDVPPLIKTEEIAEYLSTKIPNKDLLDVGILRIERKWIDSKLPETELFETLTHCYEILMLLLLDAHRSLLSEEDRFKCSWFSHFSSIKKLLPPCVIATDWDRSIWFDLKSGEFCHPEHVNVNLMEKKQLLKHYPEFPEIIKGTKKPINLKDEVELCFKQAKYLLLKDGHHLPIVILGYPDGKKGIRSLTLEDRTAKHLLYRQLAVDIEKTGANSVIFINETWVAPNDKKRKFIHAVDSPKRRESLMIVAADSYGKVFAREILFVKDEDGKIIFGEEREIDEITPNFLAPILKVWTKNKQH